MLAPGSYPFAEIYEINAPEKDVIDAIQQFKTLHPEFKVPKVTIQNKGSFDLTESEGREENSHWYFNYFYHTKENQILFTWTRPQTKNKTDFAFVSIGDGLDLGHWKDINNDLGFFENKRIKKEFEERILEQIKSLLPKK